MSKRIKPPARNESETTTVEWVTPLGQVQRVLVTFNFADDGRVCAMFAAAQKTAGTEMLALVNDACILASRLLQFGDDVSKVAPALGEDRQAGQLSGPPSSILGAIMREAADIQLQERLRQSEAMKNRADIPLNMVDLVKPTSAGDPSKSDQRLSDVLVHGSLSEAVRAVPIEAFGKPLTAEEFVKKVAFAPNPFTEKPQGEPALRRMEAQAQGYEGDSCGDCGNFTLVRNGTCMKCNTCGATTGCS